MSIKSFLKQYANARKAIAQIQAGEWTPCYNPLNKEHLTAYRAGLELWIGNGAWFCEIEGGRYFGLIWRHYVWWAAARRMKRDADSASVPSL